MSRADLPKRAEKLRESAFSHPTLTMLRRDLDELPEQGMPEHGLYIESKKTPGIVVNGELRVSIARIVSVTGDGERMVGQIQATRELDHPLADAEMRFYRHVPDRFQTTQMDDQQAWFLSLLELHYEHADQHVGFEHEIQA